MRTIRIVLPLALILMSIHGLANAEQKEKPYEKGTLLDVVSEGRSVFSGVTMNTVGNYTYATARHRKEKAYDYLVRVGNMVYDGEYVKKNIFQHDPASDFVVNDSLNVRIDSDKMYLQRPDGKELKTKIVKQTRVVGKSH